MLKEYVKQEFLDLPVKLWSDVMVIEFIIKAIEFHVDVYSEINKCAHEDLMDSIIIHDERAEEHCKKDIQALSKFYAKKEICKIIKDIEYDLEQERIIKQKKHQAGLVLKTYNITDDENEQMENSSYDDQRLM